MFKISRPQWDVIRVDFSTDWDAERDSSAMFSSLVEALDASIETVSLLMLAGEEQHLSLEAPSARAVLVHDELKQILVVAKDAQSLINHMKMARGTRQLRPIPIMAFDTEAKALAQLTHRVLP